MMKKSDKQIIDKLKSKIIAHYGKRLISLAIFGSFARGTATPESDIDILLIVKDLPKRKMKRTEEFIDNIENVFHQIPHYISPVIKTPEEASRKSPLFLDMIDDAAILYDRERYFQNILEHMKKNMNQLGSKRIWRGNRWYWLLKPDIKQGEVFEV